MKNFIALPVTASSANQNWHNNTGKLKQIFKGITGYDIMFEESRKDIVHTGNTVVATHAAAVFSAFLSHSIKKISDFIRA